MEVLADEHEHAGIIRVNTVNPGATRTAMRAAAYPAEDPQTVPTPEANMNLLLYLMSNESKGITGRAVDARGWQVPDSTDNRQDQP
jgi:NAD(P)-dependent dehydrogenase (short-subunit alcohol dehydrogenase family)